jgi:hypothetical protein
MASERTYTLLGGGPLIDHSGSVHVRTIQGGSFSQSELDALITKLEARYGPGAWDGPLFTIRCDTP